MALRSRASQRESLKFEASCSQAPAWEHTFLQKLRFYDKNPQKSGAEFNGQYAGEKFNKTKIKKTMHQNHGKNKKSPNAVHSGF